MINILANGAFYVQKQSQNMKGKVYIIKYKMRYKMTKLRVILIFAMVILLSFIPEQFPTFFGDWVCSNAKKCNHLYLHSDTTTHWGFRHWMWTLCGVVLFIWNIIDILNDEKIEI